MPEYDRNRDPDRDRDRVGAYRLDAAAPNRRKWLLPLLGLLALLLLGALLIGLFRDDDDDNVTAAAATPSITPSASVSISPAPSLSAEPTDEATAGTGTGTGTGGDAGVLSFGTRSILPLVGAGALPLSGNSPVSARGVTVQSVPSDEGFWVGSSAAQRVWVQLTGEAGESGYQVKVDDRVDFAGGRLVATPAGFADRVGVTAAEGAAQLQRQAKHVEVAKSAVRLSE